MGISAPARRRALSGAPVLWVAAAAISGFTLRRYLVPLDEGILLQAATRMTDGQWPWRDFGWAYGPGEPLVIAAAFKVLGPSALWWRLLRVAADATTAVLVWALVREEAGPRWALAAWAGAALIGAQPTGASPTPIALAWALGAVLLARRDRPGWAGAAAAAAAFWRPDLGVCAALAAMVSARSPAKVAATAAGVGAALYAPFVIAAGPSKTWDQLVAQGVRDGGWWRLPFPDGYPGRLRAWPPWTLASDLKDVAAWLVPYAALAVAVGALTLAPRRSRGLLVLALAAVAYLLSRADEEHAQPLAVLACAVAPLIVRPWPARALAVAALALILAVGAANRLSALLRPAHLVALHLPGVTGIEVPPGEARALPPMVSLVDRLVPPRQPIYVAPRRSDLVTRSDPLVHFLVRRPNVLDRDVLLQARPREQAQIVAALRRARPRVVVRWTDPASSAPEPNPRGRPSGSRALDDYLAAAYRLRARFGYYDVLVPR